MPMTEDQIILARRQVGNAPDDADLNEAFDRLGSDLDAVVLEVLEIRLAELERTPSSFAIPGEYSQSTDKNLEALRSKIAGLGGSAGSGIVTIVTPAVPDGR